MSLNFVKKNFFLIFSLLVITCFGICIAQTTFAHYSGLYVIEDQPSAVFPNYTQHTKPQSGSKSITSLYYDTSSQLLYVGSAGFVYRLNVSNPVNYTYEGCVFVFPAGLQTTGGYVNDIVYDPTRKVLYFCAGAYGYYYGDTAIYEYGIDDFWDPNQVIASTIATQRFQTSQWWQTPQSCRLWVNPTDSTNNILYAIFGFGQSKIISKINPTGGTESWVTFSSVTVTYPVQTITVDSNYAYFSAYGGFYRVPHTNFVTSIADQIEYFPLGSGMNTLIQADEKLGVLYVGNSVGVLLASTLNPPYNLLSFAVLGGGSITSMTLDSQNNVTYLSSWNGGVNRVNLDPFNFWDGWATTAIGPRSISSDGLSTVCTNCVNCPNCKSFTSIAINSETGFGFVGSFQDNMMTIQLYECSIATTCDSCFSLDPIYCGWCLYSGNCTQASQCSGLWLNTNSVNQSCPNLYSISPNLIYDGGVETIFLSGSGFSFPELKTSGIVLFNDSLSNIYTVAANSITWINDSLISLQVPAMVVGSATVQLYLQNAPYTPSIDFTVYNCSLPCESCSSPSTPLCGFCADSVSCVIQQNCSTSNWFNSCPAIYSLSQNSSLDSGGTLLSVSGTLFINSPSYECAFGSVIAPATYVSNSLITCSIPPYPVLPFTGYVPFQLQLSGKNYTSSLSFYYYNCSTSASCYDCLIPLQPQCHFDLFTQTCYFQCANCSSTTTCPMFTSINPPSSMNSGNPVLYVNATYFVNSTLPYACQFGVGPTVVSIFATLLSSTSLQCSAPPYSSVLTGNPAPYTGNVPFVVTLGGSPYFPVTSYYYYDCPSQATCWNCLPSSNLNTACQWCIESNQCFTGSSNCSNIKSQYSQCPVLTSITSDTQYYPSLDPYISIFAPSGTFPPLSGYTCTFSFQNVYDIGLYAIIINTSPYGYQPVLSNYLNTPSAIYYQGSFPYPIYYPYPRNYDGVALIPGVPNGVLYDVGIIWSGFINIKLSGTYYFYSTSDDGCRLYVNNTLIIDDWYDQGARSKVGSIHLEPGLKPFEFDYYQDGGGSAVELYWSGPGFSQVLINPEVFLHEPCGGTSCQVTTNATQINSSTLRCPPAPLNISLPGIYTIPVSVALNNIPFSQTQIPVYYYDCESSVCSGCVSSLQPRCSWCTDLNQCIVDSTCGNGNSCPSLISVSPTSGSTYGGTLVTIKGSFIPNSFDLRCRFDVILVQANYVDNTTVTCISPSQLANNTGPKAFDLLYRGLPYFGSISVTFTYYTCSDYNGNCSLCLAYSECSECLDTNTFRTGCETGVLCSPSQMITSCPNIFTITPDNSPTFGGQELTISGPTFPYGYSYQCTFVSGSQILYQFATPLNNTLTCYTPVFPLSKKRTSLNLWNFYVALNGVPYTSTVNFTVFDCGVNNTCATCNSINLGYYCGWCLSSLTCTSLAICAPSNNTLLWRNPTCPSLQSVTPNYGGIEGGTLVTIIGTSFYSGLDLECDFNGNSVPADVISDTKITCVSPSSSVDGQIPLTITVNQKTMLGPVNFEYINCNPLGQNSPSCSSCVAINAKCGICESTNMCTLQSTCSRSFNTNCANVVLPVVLSIFAFFIIVVIIVGIILYYRRHKHKKAKELFKPDFFTIAFGTNLNSLYNLSNSQKSALEKLENLIINDDLILVDNLSAFTQVTESDELAKNLTHLFEKHGKMMQVILYAIKREIETAESAQTLFRANSLASKLFKHYSKMIGCEFLYQRLALILHELNRAGEPVDSEKKGRSASIEMQSFLSLNLEVNPDLIEDTQDLELNKLQLELAAGKIYRTLTINPKAFPLAFRKIMNVLWNEVGTRFDDNDVRVKAIGGFLFLRFICASLASPHIYGLLKLPPNAVSQRYFILLSKTLQNIANLVTPGNKEAYMEQMTSFISSKLDPFRQFCASVSQLSQEELHQEPEKIEVPHVVVENSLVWLYNHIVQNKAKLDKQLQDKQLDSLSKQIDEIIQEVGLDGETFPKPK